MALLGRKSDLMWEGDMQEKFGWAGIASPTFRSLQENGAECFPLIIWWLGQFSPLDLSLAVTTVIAMNSRKSLWLTPSFLSDKLGHLKCRWKFQSVCACKYVMLTNQNPPKTIFRACLVEEICRVSVCLILEFYKWSNLKCSLAIRH